MKKENMFVCRKNQKGSELMMAKPCNCCMNYIEKNLNKKGYKLNKIYYTNKEGEIEYV